MRYTADFETTTNKDDCRVWAWGVYTIDSGAFTHHTKLDKFIKFLENSTEHETSTFYFHNLKFDGEFILYHLLSNGFEYVKERKYLKKNTFTTLITESKIFYSIEICFDETSRWKKKAILYDSLKIIPFSVDKVAKDFTKDLVKLEIDYHKTRPLGYEPTPEEIKYLKADCEIMGKALKTIFDSGLNKMTTGSNALYDFKQGFTKQEYNFLFPELEYDSEIRESYKGGFAYVNKQFRNKELGNGFVYDINSLYPWVMYEKMLPYGTGLAFNEEYKLDEMFPLYIQYLTCTFKLKDKHVPTIQLKNNYYFKQNEYIENSGTEETVLCLTSVDLKLFLKHYDVENITYHGGWKFRARNDLFKNYIDKWSKEKINAKIAGNKSKYTLAKLMLNSLYGKFGTSPRVRNSYPILTSEGIRYKLHDPETKKALYIPIATFITAYAREKIITEAQNHYNIFAYADTDSLHLITDTEPATLEISDTILGQFKKEYSFSKAKFIRAKCYLELLDTGEQQVTIAGMKASIHKYVSFDNFKTGATFSDKEETDNTVLIKTEDSKLTYKHVRGGVILTEIPFTLQA